MIGLDVCIRFLVAPSVKGFCKELYMWLDLSAFFVVSYSNAILKLVKVTIGAEHNLYNGFFLLGIARFLRLRRSFKVLDDARKDKDIKVGHFRISSMVAAVTVISVRIFLFVLGSAVIMMTLEWPCYVREFIESDNCHDEFKQFHVRRDRARSRRACALTRAPRRTPSTSSSPPSPPSATAT